MVERHAAVHFGAERVLTEITLGAAGRFAAFDAGVTLTVRAADGDERQGPIPSYEKLRR